MAEFRYVQILFGHFSEARSRSTFTRHYCVKPCHKLLQKLPSEMSFQASGGFFGKHIIFISQDEESRVAYTSLFSVEKNNSLVLLIFYSSRF